MLLVNRVIVFHREKEHCVVLYNLDVTRIKKITFKKDDKTVLSLYFVGEGEGVFMLRVKLAGAKELLEDIQIMIEDYSK